MHIYGRAPSIINVCIKYGESICCNRMEGEKLI